MLSQKPIYFSWNLVITVIKNYYKFLSDTSPVPSTIAHCGQTVTKNIICALCVFWVKFFIWNGWIYGRTTLGFFNTTMNHVILQWFFMTVLPKTRQIPPYSLHLAAVSACLLYREKTFRTLSRTEKSVGKSAFYRTWTTLNHIQLILKKK